MCCKNQVVKVFSTCADAQWRAYYPDLTPSGKT